MQTKDQTYNYYLLKEFLMTF